MNYNQYKEKMFDIKNRAAYNAFCAMVKLDRALTEEEKFFLMRAAWQNYIDYNLD